MPCTRSRRSRGLPMESELRRPGDGRRSSIELQMVTGNTPNPYEATKADERRSPSVLSLVAVTIGLVGFILGISPSLYMCYICIASLWTVSTMDIPTTSIRPMGLAFAMIGLTIAGVASMPISLCLSWTAKRLGSEGAAMLARSSVGFFIIPFALGFLTFIAIMIICGFRGIVIGD